MKQLWDTKYRPKELEDYIFQSIKQQELIESYINRSKPLPHLMFAGHQGTGKTSLAHLLRAKMEVAKIDFLEINASLTTSINNIKKEVTDFVETIPLESDIKIVFLDEADGLSPEAQRSLKVLMEQHADTAKFIIATNYPGKISPALKSRLTEVEFKSLDVNSMTEKFLVILMKEGIKVASLEIVDEYVKACYPDFRSLLITAQSNVKDKKLQRLTSDPSGSSELMVSIVEYIENEQWDKARDTLAGSISDNQWEECFRFLYEYLHGIGKFTEVSKWKKGIVIISEHLYRHATVADPEINFAACLIKLSEV